MFSTVHFQGEIVFMDNNSIVISLYSPLANKREYKGQLVYCVSTNLFCSKIGGLKDLPEFQKELSEGLTDLMKELRKIGLYPPK